MIDFLFVFLVMALSISKTPESECLFTFAENRIKKKLGVIFLFTGETGRGKSYAGIRFLELWYKRTFNEEFNVVHVCETLEQAMIIVKGFTRKAEGILIEELSVLASNRDSLTTSNKLWNKFLDVVRIKQVVIIANCPHISFIDKHFQMMCQAWINCERVDFEKEIVLAHPLWLQTSPHKSEPYRHRFLSKHGEQIDYCFFRKPSKEILEAYDKLKIESTHDLIDEISQKMRHDRIKQIQKIGQKVLSPRETEAYIHWINGLRSYEAAEKMKLEGEKKNDVYTKYLRSAKTKLTSPEYQQFAKELTKMNKNHQKTPQTPEGEP